MVGGGDSAIEGAMQLAESSTASVTLSYRGAEVSRCREANRRKTEELVRPAACACCPSEVVAIRPREVELRVRGPRHASRTTS